MSAAPIPTADTVIQVALSGVANGDELHDIVRAPNTLIPARNADIPDWSGGQSELVPQLFQGSGSSQSWITARERSPAPPVHRQWAALRRG